MDVRCPDFLELCTPHRDKRGISEIGEDALGSASSRARLSSSANTHNSQPAATPNKRKWKRGSSSHTNPLCPVAWLAHCIRVPAPISRPNRDFRIDSQRCSCLQYVRALNPPPHTHEGSLEEETSEATAGVLRVRAPDPTPATQPLAVTSMTKSKRAKKITELINSAISLGLMVTPMDEALTELGRAFAARLARRSSERTVYQTCSLTMKMVSKAAVETWLPANLITTSSPTLMMWETETVHDVLEMAGPLLRASAYDCAGLTKSFKSESEKVIRLIACVLPGLDATWTATSATTGTLKSTYQYVLIDEDGEMHKPKDGKRIEMELDPDEEEDMREQALVDVRQLYDRTAKLSPGFLRRLGKEEEAAVLEAKLMNNPMGDAEGEGGSSSTALPVQGSQKSKRKDKAHFEIDCIVGERPGSRKTMPMYLVRWVNTNYHESWEVYRMDGSAAGSPLETWEPEDALRATQALKDWRSSHSA